MKVKPLEADTASLFNVLEAMNDQAIV